MNLEVRVARAEDAEDLARLNLAFNGPGGPDAEVVRRSIRENPQEIPILATVDGQGVGFCCLRILRSLCYADPVAEVSELYVEPQFRRKHLAARMMHLVEDLSAERSASEIHLLTGGTNHAARLFYERMGYRQDGEVHYGKDL